MDPKSFVEVRIPSPLNSPGFKESDPQAYRDLLRQKVFPATDELMSERLIDGFHFLSHGGPQSDGSNSEDFFDHCLHYLSNMHGLGGQSEADTYLGMAVGTIASVLGGEDPTPSQIRQAWEILKDTCAQQTTQAE